MAADRVSQTQIAARLGVNRRTVKPLLEADDPPRYRRAPAGSMLDPLEPVIGKLVGDWAPRVTEVLRDAPICSLHYSGAATAHFGFDMTIESFLDGHVGALDWPAMRRGPTAINRHLPDHGSGRPRP
jgi:hypothetical protein